MCNVITINAPQRLQLNDLMKDTIDPDSIPVRQQDKRTTIAHGWLEKEAGDVAVLLCRQVDPARITFVCPHQSTNKQIDKTSDTTVNKKSNF